MADSHKAAAIGSLAGITLDVQDLDLTKRFWQSVLGVEIKFENEDWVAFARDEGSVGLDLQRVPEEKSEKNRAHMDIVLENYDVSIDRLVQLGGKIIRQVSSKERRWSIMQDPEGNEFCAVEETG